MISRVQALSCAVLLVCSSAYAQTLPNKQSNAGDSISQGFDANNWLGEHADLSFVQGTSADVDSVYTRYLQLNPSFTQQPESVSGAELVGGGDSFPAQAARICAQDIKPDHVTVLLGGNDVCNRPSSSTSDATANMYSVDTWVNALRAGLDQLAQCLPDNAVVHMLSMPRVDFLYDAGNAKGFWCSWVSWRVANICRIVTNESDPGRREQIGQRINAYNDATLQEIAAYNGNQNGNNPRFITFVTDWQGSPESGWADTSVGSHRFTSDDINALDCFHPSVLGQTRLACAVWASNPDGWGNIQDCMQ